MPVAAPSWYTIEHPFQPEIPAQLQREIYTRTQYISQPTYNMPVIGTNPSNSYLVDKDTGAACLGLRTSTLPGAPGIMRFARNINDKFDYFQDYVLRIMGNGKGISATGDVYQWEDSGGNIVADDPLFDALTAREKTEKLYEKRALDVSRNYGGNTRSANAGHGYFRRYATPEVLYPSGVAPSPYPAPAFTQIDSADVALGDSIHMIGWRTDRYVGADLYRTSKNDISEHSNTTAHRTMLYMDSAQTVTFRASLSNKFWDKRGTAGTPSARWIWSDAPEIERLDIPYLYDTTYSGTSSLCWLSESQFGAATLTWSASPPATPWATHTITGPSAEADDDSEYDTTTLDLAAGWNVIYWASHTRYWVTDYSKINYTFVRDSDNVPTYPNGPPSDRTITGLSATLYYWNGSSWVSALQSTSSAAPDIELYKNSTFGWSPVTIRFLAVDSHGKALGRIGDIAWTVNGVAVGTGSLLSRTFSAAGSFEVTARGTYRLADGTTTEAHKSTMVEIRDPAC